MRARVAALVVVAGCGRIGFDPVDGVGAAATGGCPPNALFCEDFESGDLSKWSDTYISPRATLVVDSARVHSGMYALHGTVMSGSTDGDGAAAVLTHPKVNSGVLALRAWIFQLTPLVNFDGVLVVENLGVVPSVLVGGDQFTTWVASEGLIGGATMDHHSTVPTSGAAWTCVELDYTFGSPAQIEVYVDDVAVLRVPATQSAAYFTEMYAGVARAEAAGCETIVDDLVMAPQHVGCN